VIEVITDLLTFFFVKVGFLVLLFNILMLIVLIVILCLLSKFSIKLRLVSKLTVGLLFIVYCQSFV